MIGPGSNKNGEWSILNLSSRLCDNFGSVNLSISVYYWTTLNFFTIKCDKIDPDPNAWSLQSGNDQLDQKEHFLPSDCSGSFP